MKNLHLRRIAHLYSECRDPEELAKLREMEQIYHDEVIAKLGTIGVLANKIDKIDDKLKEILYGK